MLFKTPLQPLLKKYGRGRGRGRGRGTGHIATAAEKVNQTYILVVAPIVRGHALICKKGPASKEGFLKIYQYVSVYM